MIVWDDDIRLPGEEAPHQHIRDQHRAAQIESQKYDRLPRPPQPSIMSPALPCIGCGWPLSKCRREVEKSGTVCCLICDHDNDLPLTMQPGWNPETPGRELAARTDWAYDDDFARRLDDAPSRFVRRVMK